MTYPPTWWTQSARLTRENETLRQQAARELLGDDWRKAQDLLGRIAHNEALVRALYWALGGAA